MFSFQGARRAGRARNYICQFLFAFVVCVISLPAQKLTGAPAGVAWQVRGSWAIIGKSLHIDTGDAISPGSLLQPGEGSAAGQSITILLPDGQRILYECFTTKDCARGFRVPQLYRTPEPFAVDILGRIRAGLVRGKHVRPEGFRAGLENGLPRDEALAALDSGNHVQISGLAANLPNGRYTGDLRRLDSARPSHSIVVIEKNAPFVSVPLPSSGLYDLTIFDNLNTPRIDVFIAAVKPAQAASFRNSYRHAQALMKKWNGNYVGWPVHDFQRAYLESLMLGLPPKHAAGAASASTRVATAAGVTAEPAFSPKPGVFDGDVAVKLRCDTPNATMHFTVDGAEPRSDSEVYGAPIIVKGTELTIKSFASSPGRKDSPVVTGIFRIRQ